MDFKKEKIRIMCEKLNELKQISKTKIEYEFAECPEYKVTNTPPDKNADWKKAKDGERFGGVDYHYWLHMKIDALPARENREYRLNLQTGREGGWDSENPQFTVFLNSDSANQALDVNHTWIALKSGVDYDIYIYAYSGMIGGYFDIIPTINEIDLLVEGLYYDVNVPYEAMKMMSEDDYSYITIRDSLDKALILLDLRHFYSEDFYAGIKKCADYLKEEFYGKICGKSESVVNCIGHTHIDVAWLWTVAQTREKAQRSFSTVINLMDRYKDYKFMSSQPQLYAHVKENDPELYEKIKKRVSEGRWEVEGAMWLEADTNLASGESLVRQILYGKRFMKEEFGVESKILWLPDVFGYSAALPQILKKSGVDKFFTAKMSWNETNPMPNDIFIWEGIDGSQVFTSIIKTYVQQLNPEYIYNTWKEFKNKSLTNNTLQTFGFGDGGGGPTYEMLENYDRLKFGLPGMPKTVIKKAAEYFDEVEKDFDKNTSELKNVPKWVGEMYLEMHRGTYTSIAKNKKNNRKSELLYQQAETAAVAALVLCGAKYPEEMLRKNQFNILLNQFHDIIPGSSIKQVYDVTDVEYARILSEGRAAADESIENLKSAIGTDGGIFVYNPSPFDVSDYVSADGKTYYAENIPAHGWKVIEKKEDADSVTVDKNIIENDVIKVEFNDKYHIVSMYDKIAKREIIPAGSEANVIQIFEDYPRVFDAWEITDYYKQKMWIADDVSDVKLTDNGICIKRKYQKSEITQQITLKPHSKRLDFKTKVDWHEDHVLMKATFPFDIRSTFATYDIQFGNIARPTHRNTSWDDAKFEVCAHKWADISESDYGVSILNDCKYGYDTCDNVMRITLLKCATYPNPEADRGLNEFTYSVYPHESTFDNGGVIKESYLLNMPLEASEISANGGSLPDNWQAASSDKENVVIETIKKAEADDSVIVRMYESCNRRSDVTIKAGFDFKEVYECDLMENNIKKLESDSNAVTIPIKNYEIKTLKFIR